MAGQARRDEIGEMAKSVQVFKTNGLEMKRLDEEVRTLTGILNDAWSSNWGFTPTTAAETQAQQALASGGRGPSGRGPRSTRGRS